MKTIFTRQFLVGIIFILTPFLSIAQNGLDSLIVEKYYISNAADSAASVGVLPVGSVTYRIFIDMKQGYTFQMAYGNASHPLEIKTTTSFFNNEDRGATNPTYSKSQAKFNTVMLDSWLTAGAACVGNYGVLKSEDDGALTEVNADGILQNANPLAGIPLTQQDGMLAGTPGAFGTIGIDAEITVFDATSQLGNSFTTTNGAWYCLAGAVGPDTTNKLLIAQITTNGQLTFKLNIQIGTPTGGTEQYVAENATGAEVQRNWLSFASDPINVGIKKTKASNSTITIYPNPSNGIFTLDISGTNQGLDNYYTIYNMLGTTLFQKKINGGIENYKENIDLTSLSKGIYFLEVSCNGEKTTHKLVKN